MYARETASIATPIGIVRVHGDADSVASIDIVAQGEATPTDLPALREALAQLTAYFECRLTVFDLPFIVSRTPRGEALRAGIVAVAHGDTASYGDVAAAIGSSPRAIGQACATNPFPIVVPCHRILGSGGKLGAYSAGIGPRTKSLLLDLERPSGGLL